MKFYNFYRFYNDHHKWEFPGTHIKAERTNSKNLSSEFYMSEHMCTDSMEKITYKKLQNENYGRG